jgi:hypothetical protein
MVIRRPADVISAVPYLLGFHPENSLVAVGSGGPHGTCAIRVDLPPAGCGPGCGCDSGCEAGAEDAAAAIGERVAETLARNEFPLALLVGYGTAERVTPVMDAAGPALAEHDVRLREALRVQDGRFWSYLCHDPQCCPAEGTPFDISTSVVAAQATVEGKVALAGRAELARTVAPLGGTARGAMRQATARAEERLFGWADDDGDAPDVRTRVTDEGLEFVRRIVDRVTSGGDRPTDDEVAWLGLLLIHLRIRDEAWVRVDLERLDAHVELWRDVLRRIEEPYAAAPACLLAYAAFSAGDGGLANVALERAVRADPGYSMAHLLHDLVTAGIPPSEARLRMTPDDLAEAYGERDGPGADRRAS